MYNMYNWTRNGLVFTATVLVAAVLGSISAVRSADAPSSPFYTLRGDLSEIKAKGTIRFLVHGEADYLPRAGDPRGHPADIGADPRIARGAGGEPVGFTVGHDRSSGRRDRRIECRID